MSLYNLLFGQNPQASLLLSMLGIDNKRKNIRIRDCYLDGDGEHILLYTRNGGGNRQHYGDAQNDGSEPQPEGQECSCYGCCIKYDLSNHPNYIKDQDEEADITYACVWFRVPEDFLDITRNMADGKDPETIGEKFKEAFKKLESGDKEILERMKPMMDQILKQMKK